MLVLQVVRSEKKIALFSGVLVTERIPGQKASRKESYFRKCRNQAQGSLYCLSKCSQKFTKTQVAASPLSLSRRGRQPGLQRG